MDNTKLMLKKLFALFTRKDRAQLFILLALLILMALAETAGIASIMPFMAVVTNPEVIYSNPWLAWAYDALEFGSSDAFLSFLGLTVLGLLVLTNMLKAVCSWYTLRYHNHLLYSLSRSLLSRYLSRPYDFFLNRNTAEMGKNILEEVRQVVAGLIDPLTRIVASGLTTVAIIILLIAINPAVAILIAGVLGGTYLVIYLFSSRALSRISREQVVAAAEKFKAASEALNGIKEIRVLGREASFIRRFSEPALNHAKNNVSAGLIADLPKYALEVVAFGGIIIVVLSFLHSGQGAEELIPMVALYAFAGYRLMPALQQVFSNAAAARFRLANLDVLHQDLGRLSGIDEWEQEMVRVQGLPALPFRKQIELKDVWFTYTGASRPSINGIKLTIPINTCIGIVGPTGSGKTTIADILLGLLLPTSGEICIDDHPLNSSFLPAWQKNLGYVPQSIHIVDDTVAHNIALGIPDEDIDMAAVRRAADIANLSTFVESELPDAYNTEIGERGLRLSGGQRQRIGIARALYHDPPLLIFDEATSALDGITEEAVMDAVRKLSGRKTMVLIAHRITTIKQCDVIYQLHNGSVTHSGPYDEMINISSWFRAAAGMRTQES